MSSALLDACFFIHLLNDESQLHHNAKAYYKYFLDKKIVIKVSTISIAEYCVNGSITDLPLRHMQILPFNFNHAERAGEFARVLFQARQNQLFEIAPRTVIPNDSKLFSQCDKETTIEYFVTSDSKSKSVFSRLAKEKELSFKIIDIATSYQQSFNILL